MMYDELIKWLRETPSIPVDAKLHNEAADAIEGLQKCVDDLEADNDKLCERIKDLSKWIPLTERLPDHRTTCLIVDDGVVVVGWRNLIGEWYDVAGDRLKYVTHWMPLPEPPKDGEA